MAFSDAFFPFSDGIELIEAGIRTHLRPGGAKRDQNAFDLCDQRGLTYLTIGRRRFRF